MMTNHKALLQTLAMTAACCLLANDRKLEPGLVADYRGGAEQVTMVTALPELGLGADESPHPAVPPAFSVVYRGFLKVEAAGRYRFFTTGNLVLDGNAVGGEVVLAAGLLPLTLRYERAPGPVRFGLAWESEDFIREPVPPTVLLHDPGTIPAQRTKPQGSFAAPFFRIANTFNELNCNSCHDQNFLATMHHKFRPEALPQVLRHAGPAKWQGKPTGPILPDSELMRQLVIDLRKLPSPKTKPADDSVDHAAAIHMVGAKTGLACIACHGIKHHRSDAESKGPNLAVIARRVNYDWFVRWMSNPGRLKPGVPMPAFFAAQSPAQRQRNIDALWHYMRQGTKMQMPPELKADPNQFVLKPSTRAMVHRLYLRLPDGRELVRAITVGLPNGMSYCLDAESCQLVYAWSGGYVDLTDHWKSQSLHPIKTVGETLYLPSEEAGLRIGDATPVFKGYQLVNGIPRFEYTSGETRVKLAVTAVGDGLRMDYEIGGRAQPVRFVEPGPASGLMAEVTAGSLQDARFSITLKKAEAK